MEISSQGREWSRKKGEEKKGTAVSAPRDYLA